jgi:methylthioribose-1-phosphate isomerase
MKVNSIPYRSIWRDDQTIKIIDQTRLPHEFSIVSLESVNDTYHAIHSMQVRGAPLIGATAAYGICLALKHQCDEASLNSAIDYLSSARPTAINLQWALKRMHNRLTANKKIYLTAAFQEADTICNEDISQNKKIGKFGYSYLKHISQKKSGNTVNVLTHCNAGWLATVDWGTALAPIYYAFNEGIDIHVWVDETRPRNQGAALTAWELQNHGVPCTVIVDNAGGHLMQNKLVDVCIVGTDRTVANGDVCNKIGTYLKALAAHDNNIPFLVALPSSTYDNNLQHGRDVPIENRDPHEVSNIRGVTTDNTWSETRIVTNKTQIANPAFDITPAKLITNYITDNGILKSDQLFRLSQVQE